jgi:shikimate dehydrogenase
MTSFGLIGFPLIHSFSSAYFAEKFRMEGLKNMRYDLFPIENIYELLSLIRTNPDLRGLNVTIPHKVSVIQLLQHLDTTAETVGAVNTVSVFRSGNSTILKGYNTDVIGFEKSLIPLLKPWHLQALVLGAGGASKAVRYVLGELGIHATFVSRKPSTPEQLSYEQLSRDVLNTHQLVINTTPLGKYPSTEAFPPIPYEYLTENNLLYDLNYNPDITRFMQLGAERGAIVKNGLEMLHLQADASWNIWKLNR